MENQNAAASSKSLVKVVIGLWAGVLLGLGVILVLYFTGIIPQFLGSGDSGEAAQQPPTAKLESSGILLPEIALTDLSGGEVLPSAYRGKIVVMNFWATWCGPCIQEMPMFQEYQDRYSEIVLLGVNEEEAPELVQEFLGQFDLDYIFLLDRKAAMGREFRVTFLPTTIIADENGEVRFRHYGLMSEEQMDHYLGSLGVSLK